MRKQQVLFVCIHNSARSQMAEELLRLLAGDRFDVVSAGIEPGKINPFVAKVLLEDHGIDISNKKTNAVANLITGSKRFDVVVTVCDEASAGRCPVFPGKHQRLHWPFDDPSRFVGGEKEHLAQIRVVRDQILLKLKTFLLSS